MVGLIIVSVMVAAFAPVITKKVSNTTVALSQQDNVNGKNLKYKIYNYSDAMNGKDGCSVVNGGNTDGIYLKCPFTVPETVDKVGFVLVSGGGGGAGGGVSSITPRSTYAQNGSYTYFTITNATQGVKVPTLISAGGGGGGGYYYYHHKAAETIHPKSQAECDKIQSGTYFTGNSCVTKSNQTGKTVGISTVTSLKSNTSYSSDKGAKACWDSGNTGYSTFVDASNSTKWHKYAKTAIATYPVCTYSAAQEICSKFGTGAYLGKWRLITSSEAYWLSSNHPITVFAFANDSGSYKNNKCHSGPAATRSIAVNWKVVSGWSCSKWEYSSYGYHYNHSYNPCLPEYAWDKNGDYALITNRETFGTPGRGESGYVLHKYVTCSGGTVTGTDKSVLANFDNDVDSMKFLIKERAPFSVRCAISDLGTSSEVTTYNHASGGGGASGGYIANITIPDNVIKANVGGRVEIKSGSGGSNGGYSAPSTDSGTAGSGSQGGLSYVYVKNSAGQIRWAIELYGGNGGSGASNTSAGSGGSAINYYRYYNGSNWYNYTYASSSTGVGSFTPGRNGGNGNRTTGSGTQYGGSGGAAIYYTGTGGQGGIAYDQSAGNGYSGTGGYVQLEWQEAYLGAPGGGGAGGRILKMKDVAVKDGQVIWIKVGKGGIAGNNSAGGKGGTSAFGSYYVRGGYGGARGNNQTNSSRYPVAGSGGSVDNAGSGGGVINKSGTNGTAGSVNTSNLYGTGGLGGHSGVNQYMLSLDANNYINLSNGCGGYNATNSKASKYHCSNASNVNASFIGDIFINPGKIHRDDSIKYGSAGSGGGGGGINPTIATPGSASPGQDGYVYLWWEEED